MSIMLGRATDKGMSSVLCMVSDTKGVAHCIHFLWLSMDSELNNNITSPLFCCHLYFWGWFLQQAWPPGRARLLVCHHLLYVHYLLHGPQQLEHQTSSWLPIFFIPFCRPPGMESECSHQWILSLQPQSVGHLSTRSQLSAWAETLQLYVESHQFHFLRSGYAQIFGYQWR